MIQVINLATAIMPITMYRGGSRGKVQGVQGTCGFLIQLVFCKKKMRFSNTTGILQTRKKTMWFIGVEVEQETSAPPPKKNPGCAPEVRPVTPKNN